VLSFGTSVWADGGEEEGWRLAGGGGAVVCGWGKEVEGKSLHFPFFY
jgi:hypothetical protein